MFHLLNKKNVIDLVAIAFFALLAMLPSFCSGITSGNDMFQHYQFAVTAHDSIVSSDIYPSIAGTMNHGFGDVSFRFYPPLSYYVLAGLDLTFNDWYVASLAAFTLVFFVGGIGVYIWSREMFSREQSLVAAGIFIFAPFHLNEIYNNFLLAEFSASAIIPFCFLFVTRVVRKGGWVDIAGLAISYSLLILVHLPLTVISSIALLLYGITMLRRGSTLKSLVRLSAAVALGLAMSAFYWLRMVTELDWIRHSSDRYSSGIWGYSSNFLLAPQHFLNFQDDFLNLWFADLMLFSMLVLSLPTVVFLFRNRLEISRTVVSISVVFAFAIFITTELSRPIWESLAFLQRVQFPWRWMAVISVVGSVFASIGLIRASERLKNSREVLFPIAIGISVLVYAITSAIVIKGAVYNPHDAFNLSIEKSRGNETFDGWWPRWTQPAAFSMADKISAGDRNVTILTWTPTEKVFDIESGDAQPVSLAALYYPYWTAAINERPTDVSPTTSGLISVQVPAEAAHIRLEFEDPMSVRLAYWTSGVMWLAVFIFIPFQFVFRRRKRGQFS